MFSFKFFKIWLLQLKYFKCAKLFNIFLTCRYPAAYENMKDNIKQLATPFDVHETILDILHSSYEQHSNIISEIRRGISLFKVSLQIIYSNL